MTDQPRLAPSSKLAIYLATLVWAYSLTQFSSTGALVLALLAVAAALPAPDRRYLMETFARTAVVFAASIFIIRALLEIVGSPGQFALASPATTNALRIAGRETMRVLVLLLGAAILIATTSARDVLRELENTRLPRSLRLVVMTVIQYPRVLRRRYHQVLEAQIARGGEQPDTFARKVHYGLSLLLPLVHAELNAVGDRAALIRTRGLDIELGGSPRWLRARTPLDLAALGIAITASLLALWIRRSGL